MKSKKATMFIKRCRRCENLFNTKYRHSRVCPKCRKSRGWKEK